jgi:hypothetical protein
LWPFGSRAGGPRPARGPHDTDPFWARQFWDGVFGSVIPCRSLLVDPTRPRNPGPTPDAGHTSEQRRLRVRARNIAFNQILAAECAVVLRCRFDDGAVFDLSANREPDGTMIGDATRWTFVDRDISVQDHFHPSFSGQQKLAFHTIGASYDFTDTEAPALRLAEGYAEGLLAVSALDDAGVRGFEHRLHRPDGAVTPWEVTLGPVGPTIVVTGAGTTVVEVRALDLNGNQSASQFAAIDRDHAAGAPASD